MQFSWKNPLHALSVLLLLAAYAGAAFGVAGNVQFVIGDVKLTTRAGVTRALQKGAEINEGDRVVTAAEASAQIKMVDGGFIAIRPNTDMGFDTYRYSGKEDGTESAIVSLLQGGFRTITGIIGRTNKQNYLVKTVTATIGIRGTDHEPMVILAPRPGQVAVAAPGTYDKVNVGIAFIRNDAGSVDIHRNQVGFAPETKAPPVVLPRIPPFYKPTPAPGPQKAKQEAKDEGKKEAAPSAAAPAEKAAAAPAEKAAEAPAQIRDTAVVDPASSVTAPPAVAAAPVAVAPVVAITATGASGTTLNTTTQTATTSSGTTAPITQTAPTTQPTTGLTPAVPIAGGTGTYRQQLIAPLTVGSTTYNSNYNLASGVLKNAQNYLFDASGNLVSILSSDYRLSDRGGSGPPSNTPNAAVPYTGTAGGLPSSPLTGATVVFAGGTTPDGNYNDKVNGIRMGRYAGGAIATVDASNTANPVAYVTQLGSNSLNWAVREIPVGIPLTGSFEYTPAYASKPTDSLGNVGTLNYASLSANFTTQTVNPAVGITINNQNLSSAAANVPIGSNFGFDVSSNPAQNTGGGGSSVQVKCYGSNCAPAPVGQSGSYGARFTGGLAGTGAGGAFFRYDFNTRYDPAVAAGATGGIPTGATNPVNDYIQGLVAFTKGTAVAALPVPTATTGNQSISTTYFRSPPAGGSYYQSWSSNYNASPTSYTNSFGTGSPNTISESVTPNDPTPASETLTGATVAQAPTNATSFAATGVSFGRYDGGTISGVDWQGTSFSGPNVGNYAWIKGPDVGLMNTAMRGTAKYVLDGSTTPSSITGTNEGGTVNSAVLAVNFNTSAVGVELSVSRTVPAVTWTATTTSSGILSGNPATTLRLSDGASFYASTWNTAYPALHESLYVTKDAGATNAPGINGQINGHLTGDNLSGALMTYSFQNTTGTPPGFGTNGAVAFALGSYTDSNSVTTTGTSAIDSNNVPYMLRLGVTGLNATAAAVRPGEYLTRIRGSLSSAFRLPLGTDGLPMAWDSQSPITVVPTCSPTPCTPNSPFVNEVPVRVSIDPSNFVATGVTPTPGLLQVALPAGKNPATVLESGFDPATGMRWGRYGGGVAAVFDRIGGNSPTTYDVTTQNLHTILGPTQTGPTMLPVTGTYAYTNVGGTKPTDNLGSAAGTLNAAALVADFGAQTVNAGVNLSVAGQTWAAGGTAIPIQRRLYFEAGRSPSGTGNLNVCVGATCGTATIPTASSANTSGRLIGGFTGTSGQGLGMAYSLNQGGIAGTTVSGVTAFRR
ncbi:MAG: FecR domain-containing protein [Betaproteobacteria bacterium]|nr:FecR domain-containing protein [Betaproteobacteria bacterium]